MMSDIPKGLSKKDVNNEILRAALIAELDAVNLYEQMAALATDRNVKAMLLDIAKEEKTHIGEFQALLLNRDKQQVAELEAGKREIRKEVGE